MYVTQTVLDSVTSISRFKRIGVTVTSSPHYNLLGTYNLVETVIQKLSLFCKRGFHLTYRLPRACLYIFFVKQIHSHFRPELLNNQIEY